MRRLVLASLLSLAMVSGVSAATIVNGDFDSGLTSWTTTGPHPANQPVILDTGDGIPNSPTGEPFAGKILQFTGGTYSLSQTVDWTGPGYIKGSYFLGARLNQPNKHVSLDVLWNGTVVLSLSQQPVNDVEAANFPWHTRHTPIEGVGANQLTVRWQIRSAQQSWVAVDGLDMTTEVPEPATLSLLGLAALPLLRRRHRPA